MPERQTKGAIGYDVRIRAIVSATRMDPKNAVLRETIFDFENNPIDMSQVRWRPYGGGQGELVYEMKPHESVLVGIGFVTAMPRGMFYWVAPRSGLASKFGITVTNAPGTVDPDYRGEAGVLVYNRNSTTFDLKRGMRIAQIIFQRALLPDFETVEQHHQLPESIRGAGGFGSTGLR